MSLRLPGCGCMVVAVLCLACGCGGSNVATGGKPVSSGGTITLDGVALEGATVKFQPAAEGTGQPASGLSGSGGSFRLTTRNTNDGAVPGSYVVTITKNDGMAGSGGGAIDPKSPDYMKMMSKMSKNSSKGVTTKEDSHGIHANYRDAKKTPLKFEIGSSGDRNIKIELNKSGT